MVTAILALAVFSGLALIGSWLMGSVQQLGVEQERLRQVEKDLAVAKKQADIMVQNKSVDDVAHDLDTGTF